MTQHVLLGDLAPLCFVVGLTGQILRPVLALPVVERLRVLAHPLVALPLWAVDLYVWHVPFLYDAALHHDSVHALEHFFFFSCGCLMWEPVVETLPAPAWFGTGMKLGYIAAVRIVETILGNIFIWSNSAFYSVYRHAPEWGITPAHDQNLGGIVMMAEGSLVTLAALPGCSCASPPKARRGNGCSSRASIPARCTAPCGTGAPTTSSGAPARARNGASGCRRGSRVG